MTFLKNIYLGSFNQLNIFKVHWYLYIGNLHTKKKRLKKLSNIYLGQMDIHNRIRNYATFLLVELKINVKHDLLNRLFGVQGQIK